MAARTSSPNSTGESAELVGAGTLGPAGSISIAASGLPASSATLLITSQTTTVAVNPGTSVGTLCLGGSVGRYLTSVPSSPSGTVNYQVSSTISPQPLGPVFVVPGDTWHFQLWFRDGQSNPSGFSKALRVVFP